MRKVLFHMALFESTMLLNIMDHLPTLDMSNVCQVYVLGNGEHIN